MCPVRESSPRAPLSIPAPTTERHGPLAGAPDWIQYGVPRLSWKTEFSHIHG